MNVDEMQKKLSEKATREPEHRFENLYSLLYNAEWRRIAWKHVSTNSGSETAGVDKETMTTFEEPPEIKLGELREQLKARTFEPMPVRRVYIPKAHGKRRPLGIPTIADRIVQEALRMILEPIWESDFSIHSYGFRPNRSTYDALSYRGNHLTGQGWSYQWVVEGDIASYFDTIPHRRLLQSVHKRVADQNIHDLLWKFLRAGGMERDERKETLTGTPQGGIVSPLLANIYLHDVDRYRESTYLKLSTEERRRRRKQGKGNYLYVRYADDFIVLCNGTKAEAQQMKEELRTLLDKMGLTLSEEKTKITHITEGFTFLGYQVIRERGQKGKMVPKVLIPESAIKRHRNKIREMLAPGTTGNSVSAKIMALNRVSRGWCQYYRATSSPSREFAKLAYGLFWGMAHWLGRKYQANMPEIMQRFYEESTWRTTTKILVMPTEYKAKRLKVKTWHNPYTEKEKIAREKLFSHDELWTGHERRHNGMDLREEVLFLKGPTCNTCGKTFHPSEVQVDHIKPRTMFKDHRDADRLDNQQVLCTLHHREKTKNDLKVLSRVR